MTADGFDEARESRAVTRLITLLARNIVPLFRDVRGRPSLVGTGLLVSAGERSFLVSAAHVFDGLDAGGELYLYIGPSTRRRLSGRLRKTNNPSGDLRTQKAPLDVGVLLLTGPGLPPYPPVDKCCLPVTALMPRALPRQGKHYLVTGFPSSKSRPNPVGHNITSKVYAFRNLSAQPKVYTQLGMSDRTHILVSFDRRRAVFADKRVATFPDPRGMSGAPVWLLFDENGPNDPAHTPVVGIAIEHRRDDHVIVATDVAMVAALIPGPW
jgi:hypothetical protein